MEADLAMIDSRVREMDNKYVVIAGIILSYCDDLINLFVYYQHTRSDGFLFWIDRYLALRGLVLWSHCCCSATYKSSRSTC